MNQPISERYTWQGWIEAFTIFSKYDAPPMDIAAEHDIIYGPIVKADISDEDKDRLEALGWHIDDDFGCFYRNV